MNTQDENETCITLFEQYYVAESDIQCGQLQQNKELVSRRNVSGCQINIQTEMVTFFFFLLRIYTIYSTIESWLLHLSSADHIQSPAEIFMSNFDNLENFLIHERVFTKNN